MSDQRKIIFLHLPKTGGTTLVNMLHQKYGLEQSQIILGDKDSQLLKAINQQIPFLHGHFSFKVLEMLKEHDYFSATLVRQPVERVISRFVHLEFSEEKRLQEERASYKGFEDYLESYYARNWQCQVLKGEMHSDCNSKLSLQAALQNLHSFDWVGTPDKLNEAMLDLSLKLGFENTYYPHLNKRKSRDLWQKLYDDYAPEIADLNKADQRIYEEAQKIYQRRKSIPWKSALKMKAKWALGSKLA